MTSTGCPNDPRHISAGGHLLRRTAEQAFIARQAFLDFDNGRHPPGLNFGDCFAYALARVTGEPLLFKGADFSRTDIQAAL
jgi:ribonuclease VapC